MQVNTTRFGTLQIDDQAVLHFPRGLFGFEDVHRYVLLDGRAPAPLRWLQAIDRSDLAFVLVDPGLLLDDYDLPLEQEDAWALGWEEGVELEVLVILGIPEDPRQMTANLKGPIVLHRQAQVGRQVIATGDQWSSRMPVMEQLQGAQRRATQQRVRVRPQGRGRIHAG